MRPELIKGDRARLERLLAERAQPDADVTRIDADIEDLFGERWAILVTDLSGFSRRAADEGVIGFLQTIQESWKLLLPIADRHAGLLIESGADNLLLLFKRPRRAVECALDMQRACATTPHIRVCIGIGYGDILRIKDERVCGAELNAASKLGEDRAGPGEILLTQSARDEISDVDGVSITAIDCSLPGSEYCYSLSEA